MKTPPEGVQDVGVVLGLLAGEDSGSPQHGLSPWQTPLSNYTRDPTREVSLDVVIIADSQRGLMKIGRLDDVAEKVPMRADVEVNRRCSCSECFCEFGAEVVRCRRSTPPQKEMWIIDRGRCRDAVASERG